MRLDLVYKGNEEGKGSLLAKLFKYLRRGIKISINILIEPSKFGGGVFLF